MEQTVQKALRLLEALVRSGKPRRLTELARELQLTKPNVYRLLSTLSILGYVKKDPATSLYSATLRMWEMGALLVRGLDLVTMAAPRLRRLADETRESVELAVFDAGFSACVDRVDRDAPNGSIGERVPASTCATGLALLAWSPADSLEQALREAEKANQPVPSRADVEKDLADVRARGHALERHPGVCGLAVPVRDRNGAVVAAIGVSGTEASLLGRRQEEMARMACATALDLSRELGYLESASTPARRVATVEETA